MVAALIVHKMCARDQQQPLEPDLIKMGSTTTPRVNNNPVKHLGSTTTRNLKGQQQPIN